MIPDNFDDPHIEHISQAKINAVELFDVLEKNLNKIEGIEYALSLIDLTFKISVDGKIDIKNVKEQLQKWSQNKKIVCCDIFRI